MRAYHTMWKIFVILITLGCIAGSSVAEDYSSPHDRNNLLHDPSGKSLHWKCKNAAVDGNSVTVSGKGEARASLALHKNWKYLTVELEMRLEDVVRDKEGREDAGLAFHFLTAEGKRSIRPMKFRKGPQRSLSQSVTGGRRATPSSATSQL